MAQHSKDEGDNAAAIAFFGLLAALLWLLFGDGRKFAFETVQARIVIPGDAASGAPQFDSRDPRSIPSGAGLRPVSASVIEGLSNYPSDPRRATCPMGYRLWRNIAGGAYWCYPE